MNGFQPVHDQCVTCGPTTSVTGVTGGRDAYRNNRVEGVEIFNDRAAQGAGIVRICSGVVLELGQRCDFRRRGHVYLTPSRIEPAALVVARRVSERLGAAELALGTVGAEEI